MWLKTIQSDHSFTTFWDLTIIEILSVQTEMFLDVWQSQLLPGGFLWSLLDE